MKTFASGWLSTICAAVLHLKYNTKSTRFTSESFTIWCVLDIHRDGYLSFRLFPVSSSPLAPLAKSTSMVKLWSESNRRLRIHLVSLSTRPLIMFTLCCSKRTATLASFDLIIIRTCWLLENKRSRKKGGW